LLETLDRRFVQGKEGTRIPGYDADSTRQALRRFATEIGLNGNGERNPLHPHNLRHSFSNALKNGLVPLRAELVKLMMRYNIGTAIYFNEMTSEQLTERVKPSYDSLRLTGRINNSNLEQETQELRAKVSRLEKLLKSIELKPIVKKQVRTDKRKWS
jgi:hypothetical protein